MDLNIRGIDEGLVLRLKVRAAREGRTLREVCIELLGGETGPRRQVVEPEESAPTVVEQSKVKKMEAPPVVVESLPSKVVDAVAEQKKTKDEPDGKPCPKCGRPTIGWGPSTVRCVACVQNFAA